VSRPEPTRKNKTKKQKKQVDGKLYGANHAVPTPVKMTTAILDMEAAYTDAAGRVNPDFVNLAGGSLGGLTLQPGVYKFNTGISINDDLTIKGTATDVFIFQSSGTFVVAADRKVTLEGGVKAENIFWQIAGFVNFGVGAHVEGNVLTATAATMLTESSLNGRLLAQTAVQLQMATIVAPSFIIPTKPKCVGDRSTFDDGNGAVCATYDPIAENEGMSLSNYDYCETSTDNNNNAAADVCSECGKCQ
jgi:hypothetical protein